MMADKDTPKVATPVAAPEPDAEDEAKAAEKKAEDEAKAAEKKAEDEAKAAEKAAEKAAKAEAKAATLWKDDPEARIERVFRAQRPPTKVAYVTLNRLEGSKDGVRIPAKTVTLEPTPAQQYVLSEGAEDYPVQLAACRKLEALNKIKEVDPADKGAAWIPKRQIEMNTLRQKLAQLESDESAGLAYEDE
ncbi:MAG: hypothetical protein ACYTEQ_00760 [Planctomycetota bacterium]|jgi:hypothetical protein